MKRLIVLSKLALILIVASLILGAESGKKRYVSAGSGDEPISQKVLVIIYDTHLLPGHTSYPYNNPVQLNNTLKSRLETASIYHGYKDLSGTPEISLEIVDVVTYNIKTEDIPGGSADYTQNYNAIINHNNLCARAANNEFDEVWLWADRTGHFWEAVMVGANSVDAYDTNAGPIIRSDCTRAFHIMGFNYERNVDSALHSYGHRVENTLAKFLDGKNRSSVISGDNWYEYDTVKGYDCTYNGQVCFPPKTRASCGNTHFPPNGQQHYDYDNTNMVSSDCEDWNPQHSGEYKQINCTTWGCNQEGYMLWWFQNMPGRCSGMLKVDGTPMPNWWYLIMKGVKNMPEYDCTTPPPEEPNQIGLIITNYGKSSMQYDKNGDTLINGFDFVLVVQ